MGIITPILFTVLVIVSSLLRPGYSQISDEISYLGVGKYEIIQNLNFIISGALTIIFGLGLGDALITNTPTRSSKITRGIVILFAIGLMVAGITLLLASPYPEDSSTAIHYYYLHTFASFVAFVAIIAAQFLTWRALKSSDSREWTTFRNFSLICGMVSLNFLLVFLFTSTTSYEGLTERMLAAACLIWIEVSGLKLYSLSKSVSRHIVTNLNQ